MKEQFEHEMDEAARKAIDALGRYKFWTFAYNAAWWVKLNRLSGMKRPNPFRSIVEAARTLKATT